MAKLTLHRLLAAGYFPDVLPPAFGTESFAAAFASSSTPPPEFLQGNAVIPRTSKCGRYFQAMAGGARRTFSLPNPVHYFRLAECFHRHWKTLRKLSHLSPISLTKPYVATGRQCFRPKVGFRERPAERARVRANARYVLRTDIARFFPSIYTHSIAWAIHGKAQAKTNRRNSALVGNQLDHHFQNLQDGQTIGIPIGQDISRVIAEVILAQVEQSLGYSRFPDGMRCIDDYEVGFLNRAAATGFQHRLEQALAEFELSLNPLKTSIMPLPQLLIDRWDSELRRFDFGQGPLEARDADEEAVNPLADANIPDAFRTAHDASNLLVFLNTAIALQHEFKNEGVLRFALVRLAHLRVTDDCWGLLQDFLFQCALNQPETMRLVVSNLLRARYVDGQKVDRLRLANILNAVIQTSGPLANSSNVTWALWTALLFRCRLSTEAAAKLADCLDPIAACLACELNDRKLWPGNFDLPKLRRAITAPGALYDEYWLIAYEAARNSWLGRAPRHLSADPCFRYLLAEDVAFFVPTTDKVLKRRLREAVKAKLSPPPPDSDDDSDAEDAFDLWWLRDDAD